MNEGDRKQIPILGGRFCGLVYPLEPSSVLSRDLVRLHDLRPSTVSSIEGQADAALFAS
jgi:hypothetical protein